MNLSASNSSGSNLMPGTRLGAYEIMQRLGGGGMGEVYRAKDTRLGREVAIKTISLNNTSRPDSILRFEQEARAASALNHPNIVTIYELGHANETHYIAMELVAGQTLRAMLASGPIAFGQAIAIAVQVANALAKAHEIGVIHRDLKPDNLMVAPDGTAKVLDFGLAKLLAPQQASKSDSPTELTLESVVMGTVGYMSPEQATGSEVDFRTDQFSFGAVLYEMVTGQPAFRKDTHAETLAAILRDQPNGIGDQTLQVPVPCIWIIERCLAKDRAKRYHSTVDLARDLAAIRDHLVDMPARSAEPGPVNLPVQRTALIGRERELTALQEIFRRDDVRLVTLTGPGGTGKTRLALHAAREMAREFPGGVSFVPLSAVREPEMIASAIAQAVGIRPSGDRPLPEILKNHLAGAGQPLLLLLDNFEHLVSAAWVASDFLSIAPKLKLLVTSQAALHVYGEHEFPVLPLAVPDLKSIPALEVLAALPAIALFVERARAVKRDFGLTRENAETVATLCARLDGLPLAIELAAARIKMLAPSAMLTRLESSLRLLTGGARDLPSRQQTLRGTVEWSYSLLNPEEQILFRRFSVFTGGCTLEGVEAVCNTKGDLGMEVLDGMASMVDKSLIQQNEAQQIEAGEAEGRFTMLSAIREYAQERLSESGEESAVRRAHAAYHLVLAEEGAREAPTPEWLDRFELEHDNLRAALDHLIATEDADWGLRLGAAMFRFWESREHLSEGREKISRLLKLEGAGAHPKRRSHLLFAAAVLAGEQGDYSSARDLFQQSLSICTEQKDKPGVAVLLNAQAVFARDRGDLVTASSLFEQCAEIWKDCGEPADLARTLSNLANVMKLRGDFARAETLYSKCRELFQSANDATGVAWTLNYQGDVARIKGDSVAARALYEKALAEFRRLSDEWGVASVLFDLAGLHRESGEYSESNELYGTSIVMFHALGHKRGIARVLECLARTAATQSHSLQSLRLAGAAAMLRKKVGAPLSVHEGAIVQKAVETARQSISAATGMAAWLEGSEMSLEQAIYEALGYIADPKSGNVTSA